MKKLLLLVLLFFVVPVKAETIYSQYSNYSDYSTEDRLVSDILYKKRETMYRIYKQEEVFGHFVFGMNPIEYPYADLTNYYYTDFSEWNESIELVPNRVIDSKTTYDYYKMKPIRYILIDNITADLNITEVRYYVDNVMTYDYNISCTNCADNFAQIVTDNELIYYSALVYNHGTILIDLKDYYDPALVSFEMWIYDTYGLEKKYTIKVSDSLNFEPIFLKKEVVNNSQYSNPLDMSPDYQYMGNFEVVKPVYSDLQISENIIYNDISTKVTVKHWYRYKDLLYRYFNINRIYKEGYYFSSNDEYPYQEEVTLYRYKNRHKLILVDDLIIDNYEQKLEDFIVECTTDVKIISNINYKLNGQYDIMFIFDNKEVKKKVVVDIKDNIINQLNYLIDENKDLRDDNKNLILALNKKDINIKDILQEKDKLIGHYKNEILKIKNNEVKCEIKEDNKDNGYIIKIGFLLLVIIGSLLIIKLKREINK